MRVQALPCHLLSTPLHPAQQEVQVGNSPSGCQIHIPTHKFWRVCRLVGSSHGCSLSVCSPSGAHLCLHAAGPSRAAAHLGPRCPSAPSGLQHLWPGQLPSAPESSCAWLLHHDSWKPGQQRGHGCTGCAAPKPCNRTSIFACSFGCMPMWGRLCIFHWARTCP